MKTDSRAVVVGKWGYKKLILGGCSRKWGYKNCISGHFCGSERCISLSETGFWLFRGSERHFSASGTCFTILHWCYVDHSAVLRVWEIHFAIWDPFLTISRVWELLFCVWDPFYYFILLLCQLFCHFAGLRARFCVHRPESTVCNIMFAETKVSMKQRRMRMLTCSGRICSMRTRLHGIAAISILRPALISNIIRNPQVCL